MGTKAALLTVVLAALLGRWLVSLHAFLSLPPGYTTNDSSCQLVGQGRGMVGSEDMALARHGVLIITSGDLRTVFHKGAANASPGGLWALDMREGGGAEPVPLSLSGLPAGRRFQPHGLDVSNSTDRVYAVSHNGDHSSIDIFSIDYRPECLALPWPCPPVALSLLHTLRSPAFPNSGINDVVEAGPGEVYVTQWKIFPLPTAGLDHPETLLQRLQGVVTLPISLMGIKLTTVLHCRWGTGGDVCVPATETKFQGANGITISADGRTVFVNDPVAKQVTVLARDQGSGRLVATGTVSLPVAVDNIEMEDEGGEILAGSLPDLLAAAGECEGGVAVPGGAGLIRPGPGGVWQWHSLIEHDGTKLCQISAAARLGPRLVLGSPYSEGLLLCSI